MPCKKLEPELTLASGKIARFAAACPAILPIITILWLCSVHRVHDGLIQSVVNFFELLQEDKGEDSGMGKGLNLFRTLQQNHNSND